MTAVGAHGAADEHQCPARPWPAQAIDEALKKARAAADSLRDFTSRVMASVLLRIVMMRKRGERSPTRDGDAPCVDAAETRSI